MKREVEHDGAREQGHLPAKGRAEVALHRFFREQSDAREDEHYQAAEQDAAEVAAYALCGFGFQDHAEQAQVDEEYGAAESGDREEVEHLDDREGPAAGLHVESERGLREKFKPMLGGEQADDSSGALEVSDRAARDDDAAP